MTYRELKKVKRAALKTALYKTPGYLIITLSTVVWVMEIFNGDAILTDIALWAAFIAIGWALVACGDLVTSDFALRQIWEKLNQIEVGLAETFGWTLITDESVDDENSDETSEQTPKTQ